MKTIRKSPKAIYEIFVQCFPRISLEEDTLFQKLDFANCYVIETRKENELIGFSIINENSILLLCVVPKMQRFGYGEELLKKSEKRIFDNKYKKVILGLGKNYLFQGVPIGKDASYMFFEKHGYISTWESVDMAMALTDFSVTRLNIYKLPDCVKILYMGESDKEQLLAVVESVQPSWKHYYECSMQPILLAVENKEILGFAMLEVGAKTIECNHANKVGTISCVGVVHEAREKGIGLNMVAYTMGELENQGCDEVYISYTWLEAWYSKLGYKTMYKFWMGEKDI